MGEECYMAATFVSKDHLIIQDDDYDPKEELREYLKRCIEANVDSITSIAINKIQNLAIEHTSMGRQWPPNLISK